MLKKVKISNPFTPKEDKSVKGIKEAAEKIKEKKVEVKTEVKKKGGFRIVKLKYKSYCGCGYYTYEFERKVPEDSPLQNGDYVDSMKDDDRLI